MKDELSKFIFIFLVICICLKGNYGKLSKTLFLKTLRPIPAVDAPKNFFKNEWFADNIMNFPSSSELAFTPWSGDYWPIRQGGISARYCNCEKSSFRAFIPGRGAVGNKLPWRQSVNKYHQPAEHLTYYGTSGFQDYVNNYYSPSEKYDFLLGDYDYTLTNMMKNRGWDWVRRYGDVAGWMGYCHGWAPAAIIEKRPLKSVRVTASDGKTVVEFLPDDIKALATVYWANSIPQNRFLGSISCASPRSCTAINAASFVITIVNQIAYRRMGVIFDPDPDGQIWNQPAYGYKMEYFNVLTKKVGSLQSSIVPVKNMWVNDNFILSLAKGAQSNTSQFLGINFTVMYIFEREPQHSTKLQTDHKKSKTYALILELDASNKIIGGQWSTLTQPSFVWMPDLTKPVKGAEEDSKVTVFGNLPAITPYAKSASKKSLVLRAVVKFLLKYS